MSFFRLVGRACACGLVSTVLLLGLADAQAKVVEYTLAIDTLSMEEGGERVPALAIEGQIPAPTLRANRGDTLRVTFDNRLDEAASIHWHGLLLPGDQDGVPYLNTMPIGPKQQFTFEFPVAQTGTYWYHSHTDFQIQRGVYGSIVFDEPESATPSHAEHSVHAGHSDAANGPAAAAQAPTASSPLQEAVVLFSDWSNESPMGVLENLKKDDDYYAFKKNNVQSWDRVLGAGAPAIAHRLKQSFTRMGPMDLADVAYDAFLANGQRETRISLESDQAQEIKLRLVNGSTSSYFDVEYAGGPMRVVAADGQAVEPILVQRLRMATAETYDVIVPVAARSSFELRATSFDGSGYSSAFIGDGARLAAPTIARPNLLLPMHDMTAMDEQSMAGKQSEHAGHAVAEQPMNHAGHTMPEQAPSHAGHAMAEGNSGNVIAHLTDYAPLRALGDTTLPSDHPVRTIPLTLTGNMQRYVWGFDGLTQREDPRLLVAAGDSVRLELSNQSMMHHPIHLHGHFFRVINGQGERSPFKHTVDVPPMGRVVIEFSATENQDWLFHCHNQYHMKSGMNRVISYVESSSFDTPMANAILPARRWYSRNAVRAQRNVLGLDAQFMDERHSFGLEADSGLQNDNFELRSSYSYQLSRFTAPFVSVERRQTDGAQDTSVYAGVRVLLPLFVDSEIGLSDAGDARLELGSGLQLSRRWTLDWRWNTDSEYRLGVGINLTKRAALVFGKDSEFGTGVGLSYLF